MTSPARFLVHIAREFLDNWRQEAGAEVLFSCRQLFHVVSFEAPTTAADISKHPLCRYVLPIDHELPIYPRKKLNPEATAQAIAACYAETGIHIKTVRLGEVHRTMRKFCKPLHAALCAALHVSSDAPDTDPNAPALVVAIYADRLWAGIVSAREAGAWFACNLEPLEWLEQDPMPWISRAAVKWMEASDQFRLQNIDPNRPRHWLELGAAPGGITEKLLETHPQTTVTAVDVAQMHPSLRDHPRLVCVRGDVADFIWSAPKTFDGLVCDVNGPPQIALDAVERLIKHHASANVLVMFTLKIPRWSELRVLLGAAHARFSALGLVLEARHLVANRQELSLIGRRDLTP